MTARRYSVTLRRVQEQTVTFVLESPNDVPPLLDIAQGYAWPSRWVTTGHETAGIESSIVVIKDIPDDEEES